AGTLSKMTASDPLMSAGGEKIETCRYRKKAALRNRNGEPALLASSPGEGRIIFSYEDITAGLVGYPSGSCDGYDPETAYEIMRNVLFSKLSKGEVESQPAN
ncbi:MAG: hypothetical protein NT031_06875, partial [Planctomycetota bacterium]|nr:hypothetical protein [Planctomycetota bacterium]